MRLLKGHNGPVPCLAYSPDSRKLASGGDDGQVLLWDLATGTTQRFAERGQKSAHEDWVSAVSFSPDGHHLLSASWDGVLCLWHAAGPRVPKASAAGTGLRHLVPCLFPERLCRRSGRCVARSSRCGPRRA